MHSGVALNLVGAVFNQGSTLAVNVLVANLLGREIFGQYTMVLATVASVASLAQLSMGYTATKHVAEFRSVEPAKASRILGVCAAVAGAAALVAAIALVVFAEWLAGPVLGAPDLARELRVAAIAVFFTVVNGFMAGALAGLEGYPALARAGIASGTVYALVCSLAAWNYGLDGAVAGVAASAFAQFLIIAMFFGRETKRQGVPLTFRGLSRERNVLLHFALPASLGGLLSQPALWIASAIVVRQAGGYHQLALFGAAHSFRTMVLFLPQVVNNVGMSLLNNQRRMSPDGYWRVFRMNAALSSLTAALPAALFLLAGAPLLKLFGDGFVEGQSVLAILLGAAIIEAIALAAYQIVVSRGQIWASLGFVSLPRDLTIVLLAAALAPTLGAAGLATAYLVGWLLALSGIFAIVLHGGSREREAGAPNRPALDVATRVYRATPFRPIREAYYRSFLRLVRGRRLVRTVEGITFDLDLGQTIDVSVFLQQYERDVVAIMEGLTRPGWCVLDIGANMGVHTLRLSRLVGPSGRVFAFEPMDYAFGKLVRNIALNRRRNIEVFRLALSNHNAPAQEVGYRSSWETSGERRPERSIVDFRRLDDWCVDHRITRIDLIKLDVDGHEMQVVQGGLASIKRFRPVILVEAGAWHFSSTEANPLRLLAACGYRFWTTTTLEQIDLEGIRAQLPTRDDEMAFSMNLVAAVTSPPDLLTQSMRAS